MTIVVIQCAGRKNPDAGYWRDSNGRKVLFVAHPELLEEGKSILHVKPDDIISGTNLSWRDELLRYNESPGSNPLNLLPAWKLYKNKTYELLARKYGTDRLYILSAGWGLVRADFLLPAYDITFSYVDKKDKFKQRRKKDHYNDFRMLSASSDQPVIFFLAKNYVPLAWRHPDFSMFF